METTLSPRLNLNYKCGIEKKVSCEEVINHILYLVWSLWNRLVGSSAEDVCDFLEGWVTNLQEDDGLRCRSTSLTLSNHSNFMCVVLLWYVFCKR